ncbi:hypothetical protein EYC80_002454 [Monilinia laxa]|uniref:Uncharacterized protein n=1 Tax=Monilinia laxa TaxID=61186 RepID=A0A5N6K407_MONLA|nr:hypothetical protein EYC80_002454 [Monilinia laxa]
MCRVFTSKEQNYDPGRPSKKDVIQYTTNKTAELPRYLLSVVSTQRNPTQLKPTDITSLLCQDSQYHYEYLPIAIQAPIPIPVPAPVVAIAIAIAVTITVASNQQPFHLDPLTSVLSLLKPWKIILYWFTLTPPTSNPPQLALQIHEPILYIDFAPQQVLQVASKCVGIYTKADLSNFGVEAFGWKLAIFPRIDNRQLRFTSPPQFPLN